MFARRLARSSSSLAAPSNLIRTFASTSALYRTPALADITPEGVKTFDTKQKEFRERIAEQSKKKEPSQSESYLNFSPPVPLSCPSTPTAPPASTARSPSSNSQSAQALGSHTGLSSAETTPEEETSKKGKLSSLIYGTKEGREMDREIEHSFSQVLARGKYVHSIVFHEVKPDKVDEYVELVGSWYPRMAGMPENKVHLVGSWRTEVGDCDTFGVFVPPVWLIEANHSYCSPYLGIPALSRLPRLPPLHRQSPRIPCLRQEAEVPHNRQTHLTDARILLLAHNRTASIGRCLRTTLLHTSPRQSIRMGDTLASRLESTKRSHGGRRSMVCADR